MKKHFLTSLGSLMVLLLIVAGCRKQDDPIAPVVANTTTGIQARFTSVVNGQPLVLDSAWYTNTSGDNFRVSIHRYYVSHFALHRVSGETVNLPETYILADARLPEARLIKNVPEGVYDRISFMLGVDSARNVSGAQEGDLSQSKGMFWDWNTGYIMAKLEGFSPQSPIPGSAFFYHVAGYSGTHSVLRTVTLPLPSQLKVTAGQTPTLQIQSDIASWFSGTSTVSIRDMGSTMNLSPEAVLLANNYVKGFSVVRIDP